MILRRKMGRPKTGHSAPQYHDRKVPILMPNPAAAFAAAGIFRLTRDLSP
ncbi:hypothetical protein BSS2_I1860 [Brucella suis bv. 1 str. S2]|uniref:Uncharacterized protein n=9 Tax=Brucella TaxID=234 RepID=C0RFG9_BRUMB|nr:hypothetical protein BR1924 [Brucella suis 1330]ABQ61752.1 hypothetical protein BOV_1854 [Brucella ovis ATCC 25840]ABX62958.1 Hypothetical protein, conserved [Brucella canis ATCC 23365]ABY38781.1 Hypothetical protein, conserved [Brucella suis ATCC 23445]ACO01641.1 Hypothetical protein, conserved [Brucella melitensis ATCC 23457]ACU48888.1 hypothetical protein BMI_I1946 [Brucella microti CCM 4915]AEK55210.1 hypothetical protein BPI_I1983 [Brucella pinnipedialis B2/94]AEU06903.1 hypothetical